MSKTKIYKTWTAMLSRCRNEKDFRFKDYGARGITVCPEWEFFENFYNDMGDIPENSSIDRINNDKGYYKENCRWALNKQQHRNKRSNVCHASHLGMQVQAELAEKIGWNKDQMRWHLKRYGIAWILEGYKNGTLVVRKNKEIDREDIVGSSFGYWKVVSFQSYTKKTGHMYLCECKCGAQKQIPRNNLMKNKTTCCRSCSTKDHWERQKADKRNR